MTELVHQLGLDWKLLLSQGVNFLILLTVLTMLVYRPLSRLIEERRKKIEFGLMGAEEAEKRLKEIDRIKSEKIGEAEKIALNIVGESEKRGQKRFDEIVKIAEVRANEVLVDAAKVAEHKKQEELARLTEKAGLLIKQAIIKTVELDPKHIDEKLVSEAARIIKEQA